MNDIKQILLSQGYKQEEVDKIIVVMNDPVAYQHALTTRNFNEAYTMTQQYKDEQKAQAEKSAVSDIDLSSWFSSFVVEAPEDAKALSASLTKFARYVQSMTDKGKTPEQGVSS